MRTTPPMRETLQALIDESRARAVKLPPDIGRKFMSLACINPDCEGRASVDYQGNAYHCRSCNFHGNSISLIMRLSGFDPYHELPANEIVSLAYDWAEEKGLCRRAD
jgi:hypothetical protein